MVRNPIAVTSTGQVRGAGPLPLVGVPATLTFFGRAATLGALQVIPLSQAPSQILDVTLNKQSCTLKVYFKQMQIPIPQDIPTDPYLVYDTVTPCFLDLFIDGVLLLAGVRCMNANRIVRDSYLGFTGDLAFIDTMGSDDPQIIGLGTRWLLCYFGDL